MPQSLGHGLIKRAPAGRPAAAPQAPPQHSSQWFRIAPLRPLLASQVRHDRQVLRGAVWHTLTSADGRHNFRLNSAAWSALARCDGQHTVQQLWADAQAHHAEHAATQDELLQMLARLHGAGLLSFNHAPDFGDGCTSTGTVYTSSLLASNAPTHPGAGRRQHLLAWRVSLGNPDALLARWAGGGRSLAQPSANRWAHRPWWKSFCSRIAAPAWVLLMACAAFAGLLHSAELALPADAWLAAAASPAHWGLAWLAYPLMKLLHEGAHGLVARRCGAVVSDWGITWLMFMPVPYVDASAASALPQRRQRLAVSAAGIAVELSVAAVAGLVALNVQPGALRDGALLVFYLALGSSLLVNANPLLRFDGYHMLCDALGLPNLAARSSQHWLQQLRQLWLRQLWLHQVGPYRQRQRQATAVQPAPGEAAWLWAYAPAAWAMRAVVALAVVAWLGSVSHLLGYAGLALFAWMLLLSPLLRLLLWLQRSVHTARAEPRARPWLALALPTGLLAAVLLWPLPMASVAQGVLWLPESALVRAQASGFVAQVLVLDGQAVQAGDAVLQLRAPALQAAAERMQGRVQELQAEQLNALPSDAAAAAAADHALQAAQADLALAQQRLQRLTVRAQTSGRIAINQAADLPGRHVERGALLAHVLTGDAGIVKLAIPQADAARLPTGPSAVQLLAADGTVLPHTGRWLGAPTGAQAQLPSAALGSRSGGRVEVNSADTTGRQPAQPVVVGEVQLHGAPAQQIGQRVLVRFDLGHAPLLQQAARAGQQLLLRHFNPAG